MQRTYRVDGTGLGLRRPHVGLLQDHIHDEIAFFEVAPENWLGVGGRLGEAFDRISHERPLLSHGLLLDLGGPDPLDMPSIERIKGFLDRHRAVIYGGHLSFCGASGQLFPVHTIDPNYLPLAASAQTTRIAAFRDGQNDYGFLDLNPAAARLLELIMLGDGLTGREIFARVAAELEQTNVAGLIQAGSTILARMLARDVILGSARA